MSKDRLDDFAREQLKKESGYARITDTYRYCTFIIEHELADEIDIICAGQPKGFKTRFINQAVDEFIRNNYR